MANAIKSDRFVLKVLDKRSFEVEIDVFLQKNVEGLYDDSTVGRLWGRKRVASHEDLRITSLPEPFAYVVTLIKPGI